MDDSKLLTVLTKKPIEGEPIHAPAYYKGGFTRNPYLRTGWFWRLLGWLGIERR